MWMLRRVRDSLCRTVAEICDKKKQGKHLNLIERIIERRYRAQEGDSKSFYSMPPAMKEHSIKNYLRAQKNYESPSFEEFAVDTIIILQHLVEIEPDYKEPYMLLGKCYMHLEDYPTATHYFQMAKNALLWVDQKNDAKELDSNLSILLQRAVAKRAENFL